MLANSLLPPLMEKQQAIDIVGKVIESLNILKNEASLVDTLKSKNEKLMLENKENKSLTRQVEKLQFMLQRISAHTDTYVCPNCCGDGGFQTSPESGEQCDFCCGVCFVRKIDLDKFQRTTLDTSH